MGFEETRNFVNSTGAVHHFEFVLRHAYGYVDAARETLELIDSHVHSVISALDNTEAISTLLMTEEEEILTIVAAAQSEEMSQGLHHPYKLRLPASESYDGTILNHLVHEHLEYVKVSIFFTTDTESIHNSLNFLKVRDGRKFHILSEHEIEENETDFSDAILHAKEAGANVFVIFSHVETCAGLLIQGILY